MCAGGDSAGLGRGRGSGGGWHLCSGCAGRVADRLPFYVRRWLRWVASRMLVIMNGYNQTGGSNAFSRMFSCAGMIAAMVRGGAGVLTGALADEGAAGWAAVVGAGMVERCAQR